MGTLTRNDAKLFRGWFAEMAKTLGQSVGYQWITKQEYTIHSEDNSEFSLPIRMDVIFNENPTIDTLNNYGWLSELGSQQPILAQMPYNTPHLKVGCRLMIESVGGTARPRVFSITKIASNLEIPDSYMVALAPVYDQHPQRNQYTLVNNEKISQEVSERTSKEQHSVYVTSDIDIDTTPKKHTEWENSYEFIDTDRSPYSG